MSGFRTAQLFLYSAVDNAFITDVYLSHYAQAEGSNDKERPAGPFRNNITWPERKHPPFTRIKPNLSASAPVSSASTLQRSFQRLQQQEMIGFDFINRQKAWFVFFYLFLRKGGVQSGMHVCEF